MNSTATEQLEQFINEADDIRAREKLVREMIIQLRDQIENEPLDCTLSLSRKRWKDVLRHIRSDDELFQFILSSFPEKEQHLLRSLGRPKILWAFGVHDKIDHLRANSFLVKNFLGNSVKTFVYGNGAGGLDALRSEWVDIVQHGENTGHHNGTRDALNAASYVEGDHSVVIATHSDVMFSSHRCIESILSMLSDEKSCVMTTGGRPDGALESSENMAYFCDFIVAKTEAFKRFFPIHDQMDGSLWIERHLWTKSKLRLQNQVHDLKCVLVDRKDKNIFKCVNDDPSLWISSSHNLAEKLKLLECENSEAAVGARKAAGL